MQASQVIDAGLDPVSPRLLGVRVDKNVSCLSSLLIGALRVTQERVYFCYQFSKLIRTAGSELFLISFLWYIGLVEK